MQKINKEKIINDVKYELDKIKENTCELYKEIWKFLIYSKKFDYDNMGIRFNIINVLGDYYLSKEHGIEYIMSGSEKYHWCNYYDGCNVKKIDSLFNKIVDYKLLIKLFDLDGFDCSYFDDEPILIHINVKKENLKKELNKMYNNKKLKKGM